MSAVPTAEKFPPIGMSPAVWGPIFWHTIHIVALGYSDKPSQEEQAAAQAFYNSLREVIPCPICKEHYRAFLDAAPPQVGGRQELIRWTFELHNKVNVKLGKPALTFQEFIRRTRALAASTHTVLPCPTVSLDTTTVLGAVAIVGIAGAAYYYYKNK
jgi:hypothetical protein